MNINLRPTLFWDTDVNSIDLEKQKSAVIQRIFTRGNLEEFYEALEYYGKETCKDTLLDSRWLDEKTLSFCSVIFDTPISQFRCFTLAQSNPEHLSY
jgi:hypothetical protein